MRVLTNIWTFLSKSFGTYTVRGLEIEPTYWQAGAIILLIFMLIFTLARLRYIYVHWNLSGTSLSFLFYGFLLALILEGFLIISGRTFFSATLGWENAPKPIAAFIDLGRDKMSKVLGEQTKIPESVAKQPPTAKSVVTDYFNLPKSEAQKVESQICSQ
jgi:hypothetical protein